MADVTEPFIVEPEIPAGAVPSGGINIIEYIDNDGEARFAFTQPAGQQYSDIVGVLLMTAHDLMHQAEAHDGDD